MSAHLIAIIVWALAAVETPHGVPAQPGPAQETGHWQLTPEVRLDRGAELRARGLLVTDESLALEQVLWLQRRFRVHGIEPTPYDIALAWNAGFARALNAHAPQRARDFAQRVSNLVEERR